MSKYYALVFTLLMLQSFNAKSTDDYEKALQSYNALKIDEAYIFLKNSLQQTPNHLPSKILMGKTLFSKGLAQDALIELNESLAMGADNNLVIAELAKVYLYLSDYTSIYELKEDGLSKENKYELFLVKGSAAFTNKEDLRASDFYQQAINLFPNEARGLQSLAYLYLYNGSIDSLEPLVDKLSLINDDDYKTLHLKSQLAKIKGNLELSIELLERAIELAPSDPLIKRTLASAYLSNNQTDKALSLVKLILAQTPNDPFAILLYGKLVESTDEIASQAAFNDITQKMTSIPDEIKFAQPELAFVQALSSYLSKNYEQAAIELERYMLSKRDDVNAISILADAYIKLGQEFKALALLEKSQIVIEGNIRLNLLLCDMYMNVNRDFKCVALIEKLEKQLGENNPNIVFTRVKTLRERKKNAEALAQYERLFGNQVGGVFTYTAIELLKANNKFDEALSKINQLLEAEPDNIRALVEKSDILNRQGHFELSIALLTPIAKDNPMHLGANINLASAFLRTHQYLEADQIVTSLIPEYKQNFGLLLIKSQIELAQDNNEEAIEILTNLKKRDIKNKYPSELLVRAYQNMGNYSAAISELDELLRDYFLEPSYIEERAKLHIANKNIDKAKQDLNTLYGLWSVHAIKLLQLSKLQSSIDDIIKAERSLISAQALAPNNIVIKMELIKLRLKQGRLANAKDLIDELLTTYPKNKTVRLISGEVYNALGETEKAYKEYKIALDIDNSYAIAAIKLYQLALSNVQAAEFELTLTRIVAEDPNQALIENLLADFKLFNDRSAEALAHYLNIAKTQNYPNLAVVYNNIANIYLHEYSDPKNAENFIRSAIQLQPNSATFIDTQGWILAKQGKYQEALTLIRQAFSLDSEEPQIRYHLAYILYHLDRVNEATKELNVALQSNDPLFNKNDALKLKELISQKQ